MRIKAVGHSASIFLVVSFAICLAWGLATPTAWHMHPAWEDWLPGFSFEQPVTWFIGLIEAYLYSWYIAVVFVPLYNFFSKREIK